MLAGQVLVWAIIVDGLCVHLTPSKRSPSLDDSIMASSASTVATGCAGTIRFGLIQHDATVAEAETTPAALDFGRGSARDGTGLYELSFGAHFAMVAGALTPVLARFSTGIAAQAAECDNGAASAQWPHPRYLAAYGDAIMLDQTEYSFAGQLAAVRARDPAADGVFFYSVATTGVYCYPSCAARPALQHNIGFHPTREHAARAGFRPCQRCRSDLPPRAEREAALVARACRFIEAAEEAPSLADLASAVGISPHHFHRLFRRIAGVTPKAYAAAKRQTRVQAGLAAGTPVTAAMYSAGFNSSGRFYAAANGMLGMAASRYRIGGAGEAIRYGTGPCSMGQVLVAATGRGVCAILLGDDPDALAADLHARFPRAALSDGGPDFGEWLAQAVALVDGTGPAALNLPLDIQGTAFQRRVWQALQAIPPGSTSTYGTIAAQLGRPRAVRAVAGACAANRLAVAVPCHRVVASTGALAGYRWGLRRKRALLERERAEAEAPDRPD